MTEQPMHSPIKAEPLELSRTPDGPRIETAPLPEYIAVTPEIWGEAEAQTEAGEDSSGFLWLEHPPHAGHVDADGNKVDGTPETILHIDAVNVACSYRLVAEQPDGTRLLQLGSWGER